MPPQPHEDLAATQSERQALWTKFQDSINAPPAPPESESKRMIKVEKRYRFAGEDVVEVVEVPEDSPDAKKWPLWKPPENLDAAATPDESSSTATPSPADLLTASSPSAASAQPVSKRPGRRKPKVQLAELPSADSRKEKKLTTLEKSALDWKAHVTAPAEPELAAELEANRRGGGYLEKVEFLQRVGDRKNQTFEANKDHKRRRA
ncbi:bucentaur or craniofacial development-domain-containing protein [Lactifluus subvellereus]|nr:bucentaur or craniofacial development-domain-containing protein [Lactifluus subvellereus]